eukprot:1455859-Alexandrium_andersonii.AAC.1
MRVRRAPGVPLLAARPLAVGLAGGDRRHTHGGVCGDHPSAAIDGDELTNGLRIHQRKLAAECHHALQ